MRIDEQRIPLLTGLGAPVKNLIFLNAWRCTFYIYGLLILLFLLNNFTRYQRMTIINYTSTQDRLRHNFHARSPIRVVKIGNKL